MQRKLLLLSFIEGGAVMAAELCGAKLLAPVFGSSLFVWASVMGITLAALAFGYFFGGWISEKAGDRSLSLFRILIAAALFLLLMPVLNHYLVPRLAYLPFLPGVVISTLLLLFPAVFFLGASSPLFILLQTGGSHSAGKVSGTVYAVSTAGGILATFLCGFWLIPEAGLNACLISFGLLLFVATFLVFRLFKPFQFFLLIGFGYLNLQFKWKQEKTLLSSDSILGHLEVKDLADSSRILTVNDIVQTQIDLRTKRSLSRYVSLLDTLVPAAASPQNALVLGLGGGPVANLFAGKNYSTEGVEFDPRIIEAARAYFGLQQEVAAYAEDARYFLNHCDKKYDLVMVDVFRGEEQPSHVLTKESLEQLKVNLDEGARMLINWHGYVSGERGMGTAILLNTLLRSGFHVKLCTYSADESHRNLLLVASLSELPALPYETVERPEPTALVNSDNSPLLEKYNARANKAWRLSYLRYYQSRD